MQRRRRLVIHVSPSLSLLLSARIIPSVYCLLPSFHFPPNSVIANLVIEMKFETGDEKLKDLETGVFLGAGRFVVEPGKPAVVEYKISKAVKGS